LQLKTYATGHTLTVNVTAPVGSPTGADPSATNRFGLKDKSTSATSWETLTVGEVFNSLPPGSFPFSINNVSIMVDRDTTTMKAVVDTINKDVAGVTAAYDPLKETFVIKSSGTGLENAIDFSLGGHSVTSVMYQTSTAQDAVIEYNGQQITRSSNKFTLDGMTLELFSVTQDGSGILQAANIKAEANVAATTDLIKKFVEAYNTMLVKLNEAYNTPRARSGQYQLYEPLTDEEKKALTEKEVETLENKAKEGVLYRNQLINDVTRSMRSMLYEAVPLADGRKMSIYEIGITTSNAGGMESGKLVLDENKLRKALETRPEDVAQLFTKSSDTYSYSDKKNYYNLLKDEGIGERLFHIIDHAAGVSGTFSAQAGYSSMDVTSTLSKQLQRMDVSIAAANKALIAKENRYYEMFSKMEAAVQQNNAMMAQLQSMLGLSAQ
jgi:flagellar hook-associated protein 2